MIDRIGSLLTPLLLITIVAMIIKGFVDFEWTFFKLRNDKCLSFQFKWIFTRIYTGYLTMDAIASIAFSMIVVNAIKTTGIQHADKIFKQTIIAGLIAAIALVFIYISLGYIGNHINIPSDTLKELKAKDQNIGRIYSQQWQRRALNFRKILTWYYRIISMFNYCLWINCISK